MSPVDRAQQERFIRQLQLFRERLLDIGGRNPSVYVGKEVQKRNLDLVPLGPQAVEGAYTRVIRGGGDVLLIKDRDETDAGRKYRNHLKVLSRTADSRTEESGLKELYLGLLWLEGHLDPKQYVRGPLVLVPAQLQVKRSRSPGWYLQLPEGEDPQLNNAMLAAIRKHTGWAAPSDLGDAVIEAIQSVRAAKGDVGQALTRVLADVFLNAGLPARFGADPDTPLAPLRKREIGPDLVPSTIQRYLMVGLFPQSSTALYADTEEMIQRATNGETDQGMVDNLLEAPADDGHLQYRDGIALDEVPARQTSLVVPADPSQHEIIVKAQRAECTVVRGPPGTGKSQVIVNLIADALSRGERVLVVCQKRAALDVVYERLEGASLAANAFVVHDAQADRPATYKRIASLLDSGTRTDGPPAPGTDRLGAEIDQNIAAIREVVEPLNWEVHGKKLYSLYAEAQSGFKSRLQPPADVVAMDARQAEQLAGTLESARPGFKIYDAPSHPLSGRENWSGVGHVQRAEITQKLQTLAAAASDGTPGLVLANLQQTGPLQSALGRYLTLRRKWYRFFLPTWWGASATVGTHRSTFGAAPVEDWPSLLNRGWQLHQHVASFQGVMSDAWQNAAIAEFGRPQSLAARATAAARILDVEFDRVQHHDQVKASLTHSELGLLQACAQTYGLDHDWRPWVRQELLVRWIDEAEQQAPALRGRPFQQYRQCRQQLVQLIDQKRCVAAKEISQRLHRAATTPTFAPNAEVHPNRRADKDWNDLRHQVGKKRRVWPIRKLVAEMRWPMRCVAPCWLASPEVVSEIFPLERGLFDLIIFDEASQLSVERALPVLYRAKRVVIAGDEQQMPPSNFFASGLDEDEEVEDEDDVLENAEARFAESLLVQAKKVYGFDYLAWHYRSQYEELIDFSNHAYYESTLHVAANIERGGELPPMHFLQLDGVWANQTNTAEVQVAVDLLDAELRKARDREFQSVGIITFNMKQRDAIKDEIERRRAEGGEFAGLMDFAESPPSGRVDDRPFVKNIENVQGDERDVIIFSVGYARNPDGRMYKRFGPIGIQGGENRLNVGVTRARKQVFVLCSFNPDELAVETAKNRGPRLLKKFLQYAKAVSARDSGARERVVKELNPALEVKAQRGSLEFDSPFEREVYEALRSYGYELDTQCGVGEYRIDLGVIDPTNPSRYCAGIECDGAMYHSGRSVRERDIARQQFLESRGWKIERIWSRDWWMNPQQELQRVVEKLPPLG